MRRGGGEGEGEGGGEVQLTQGLPHVKAVSEQQFGSGQQKVEEMKVAELTGIFLLLLLLLLLLLFFFFGGGGGGGGGRLV